MGRIRPARTLDSPPRRGDAEEKTNPAPRRVGGFFLGAHFAGGYNLGIMFRFAGLALVAVLAFAQQPVKPPEPNPSQPTAGRPRIQEAAAPPEVNQALRARIQEFYGYFVKEEYRKAEKLIAEDSQDWFYNHNKPHYLSFEITRIEYSDDFKKANVLALCEQNVLMIGFAGPMKIPTPSTWKLVDGQWFWYIDKDEITRTPFGVIPERASDKPAGPLGKIPVIPSTPDFAMNLVKPDTKLLEVKAGESAEVAITNTAHGPATLSIDGKPQGVEATLDHEVLTAGQKAVLSVHAAAGAHAGRILVRIHETGELIPIEIRFH
jgi:hypothetical protein